MSLSLLYGSTVWIVTAVSSAQLAFPGAFDEAAALAERAAQAAASRDAATHCPYCATGPCVLCGQGALRMDYEGCGSYVGPMFDEPCYASPAESEVASAELAPQATEPDEAAVDGNVTAERGGILSAMATAVEQAPGADLVRRSVSGGVMEASRALAWARAWLAESRGAESQGAELRETVATVEPAPTRTPTEASEKLRQWFASSPAVELNRDAEVEAGESLEVEAQPAVTQDIEADSATEAAGDVPEIDSLVPAEAFAAPAATEAAPDAAADAETFVDWEAEVAQAYLDRVHAECGQEEEPGYGDPRQDVVTPAIRTAAMALESLGQAAIRLSSQLRGVAETTSIR